MLKTPVKLSKCGTENTVHHIIQYLQQQVAIISSVLGKHTTHHFPNCLFSTSHPVNTELLEVGGSRWGQRKLGHCGPEAEW